MRLTDKKRKQPTKDEKLAATLLALQRVDAETGKLVPLIDREWAKDKTPAQIAAGFDFDHYPVAVALGGTNHPTNLVPRLRAEHHKKTATKDAKVNAKIRRSLREQKFVVQKPSADTPESPPVEKKKKRWSSRPLPGTKASGVKKDFSGNVTKRER